LFIAEVHVTYFPENSSIALNVWMVWYLSGYAVQYGYSASLCVRDKIYIQLALLALSMGCYGTTCSCVHLYS